MHRSRELGGVAIEALLGLSHVDRPPLGDVVETVAVMAATNPQADLTLEVGAGADACLAQGGELAAFGPVARRCAAMLAARRRAAARRGRRATPGAATDAAPAGGDVTPDHARPLTGPSQNDQDSGRHCGFATAEKERGMTEVLQQCGCEEASEEELLARLDDVIAGYKDKPGALIPVLQLAQGIFGYLPEVALKHVALELGKPYSEVAGVVGFYSFFSTVPRGKHLIRVCLGTACYVRGGVGVLDALRKELGDRRRRHDRRPQLLARGRRAASAPAASRP